MDRWVNFPYARPTSLAGGTVLCLSTSHFGCVTFRPDSLLFRTDLETDMTSSSVRFRFGNGWFFQSNQSTLGETNPDKPKTKRRWTLFSLGLLL